MIRIASPPSSRTLSPISPLRLVPQTASSFWLPLPFENGHLTARMSVVETTTEMKAGHPPATIVGGRRVVNRKDRKLSDSMDHSNSESSDDAVREIIDCDLPAKMEKSYPTISVKRTHEKPVPTLQELPRHQRGAHQGGHVFQPRKQTH
ncbi:unnamed protein product [Caenorhabditis sp. 36 PRJEB53466]|nr:unnamed protein product [Caenorhabditis sp. 36 PRJEB53466]